MEWSGVGLAPGGEKDEEEGEERRFFFPFTNRLLDTALPLSFELRSPRFFPPFFPPSLQLVRRARSRVSLSLSKQPENGVSRGPGGAPGDAGAAGQQSKRERKKMAPFLFLLSLLISLVRALLVPFAASTNAQRVEKIGLPPIIEFLRDEKEQKGD